MGGVRAPTEATVCVSRLECLKLEWTRGNLGTRTLSSSSSSSSSSSLITPHPAEDRQPALPAARCCLFSSGALYLHRHPVLIQRLNGSRRAHLPAVRDDRARAGLRLDAVPETERQATRTSCWTSAALKCPAVSGNLESKQPAGQDRQRREGPEEERTHREKSLMKREARHGWTLVE